MSFARTYQRHAWLLPLLGGTFLLLTVVRGVVTTAWSIAAPSAPSTKLARRMGRLAHERSRVRQVAATEYEIHRGTEDCPEERDGRAWLLAQLGDAMYTTRSPRVGIFLDAVRTGSVLAAMGFHPGDRLAAIDAFELTSAEDALHTYPEWQKGGRDVRLAVERAGQRTTFTVHVY